MNSRWMAAIVTAVVLLSLSAGVASSNVEWTIVKTLSIEDTPVDVAVSADGKRIFVLSDQGKISIYDTSTLAQNKIEVGSGVDKIQVGPRGNVIFLSSRTNKSVQVVSLDFIQTINTSGSPFKGPADAPVVIAVFDDFQ